MSRKSSGIRFALRRRCYQPDPTKLRLEIEWRVYLMGHQRPTSTSQSLTRGVKGGTKIRESTERVSGGRGVRRKGCQGGEPERRPLTHRVLCSGVKTKVACPVTGTGLIKQAVVVRRPGNPLRSGDLLRAGAYRLQTSAVFYRHCLRRHQTNKVRVLANANRHCKILNRAVQARR